MDRQGIWDQKVYPEVYYHIWHDKLIRICNINVEKMEFLIKFCFGIHPFFTFCRLVAFAFVCPWRTVEALRLVEAGLESLAWLISCNPNTALEINFNFIILFCTIFLLFYQNFHTTLMLCLRFGICWWTDYKVNFKRRYHILKAIDTYLERTKIFAMKIFKKMNYDS